MPAEMNLRLDIRFSGNNPYGVYFGTKANFQQAIQPLLDEIIAPDDNPSVQVLGWLDTLLQHSNGPLETPFGYTASNTFFAKSLMTETVTDAAIDKFAQFYATVAPTNPRAWSVEIDAHGGPTSAISKVLEDATSYVHRPAVLKYQFADKAKNGQTWPQGGVSFLNNWVDTILNTMSDVDFGMYYNYADPTLSADTAHDKYWLQHYDRLVQIKKSLDPNMVFENPQSVGSP